MQRVAFVLATGIVATVFIMCTKVSRPGLVAQLKERTKSPPSIDILDIAEEGIFDRLDNGLYIAVLKEVDGDIFDGLCVAILKNVSDPELISFIGPGFKNNLASKVEHFRPNENITKIREFIMDRQCSTSIIIPGDSLPLSH